MPELELRQPPDERPELFVLLRRQRALTVFDALILSQAGIELRLKEGEEQVEEVDAEAVGDNIPALCYDYAQTKHEKDCASGCPSICDIGGGFVEISLVLLRDLVSLLNQRIKFFPGPPASDGSSAC